MCRNVCKLYPFKGPVAGSVHPLSRGTIVAGSHHTEISDDVQIHMVCRERLPGVRVVIAMLDMKGYHTADEAGAHLLQLSAEGQGGKG